MIANFLGKPLEYWYELQDQVALHGKESAISPERLLGEMAGMRARLSFYEKRIKEMASFMERYSDGL